MASRRIALNDFSKMDDDDTVNGDGGGNSYELVSLVSGVQSVDDTDDTKMSSSNLTNSLNGNTTKRNGLDDGTEQRSRSGHERSSTFQLFFKQLYALLCKSFITRRVHYMSTFFEIIGPLLLPLLGVYIYSSFSQNILAGNDHQPTTNEPKYDGPLIFKQPVMQVAFSSSDFVLPFSTAHFTVMYAPHNSITERLVRSLGEAQVILKAYPNEEQLNEAFQHAVSLQSGNDTSIALLGLNLVGISFTNSHLPDALNNGQLSYSLLIPATLDFNQMTGQKYPVKVNQAPAEDNYENYDRFAKVISYINTDYVAACCVQYSNSQCDNLRKPIQIYRMPYPRYELSSSGDFNVIDWIGFGTVLGYVLFFPLIVKRIVDEKDCKVKEMFRMMGMSDFVFWSSHFVSFIVIIILHTGALSYIFFAFKKAVFQYSSISLFAFIFLLYGVQLILFSMVLTTIFNRPVLSTIISTILWVVCSTLIFRTLIPSLNKVNVEERNFARSMTSMLPMGSLIWIFSIMGDFENKGTGLGWLDINSTLSIYGPFTALSVLGSMIISCFLYVFLIWYLDNVWPFQHGVPKSPFFLFQPNYWQPMKDSLNFSAPKLSSKTFEREPNNLEAKIQIFDLCKSFKTKTFGKKLAVDHFWLNIYKNQLTVLLGHNGAGKTTTMNMITGMFPATSGSIFVNQYNVFTQTAQARRSIGLCPQENIYFNELTVHQHLKLFALLKDYPSSKVDQEIDNILEMLALTDKKHVYASKLSGGMKRKLALGIALIGDTETLILDEPTSGMDPEARRVIWDLLISLRRERTILLTTHYMEEADVLADRIAIMNEGKLCCSGSPLFLKNAYGTGYRLRIAKMENFNLRQFEQILQRYIPNSNLISEIETEVVFGLDTEKRFLLSIFPQLFEDIERNKKFYGVDSCGLSYTTLEDVFLTVGSDLKLADTTDAANAQQKNLALSKQSDLITGWPLLSSQLQGLFMKRLHYARRYWVMFVMQLAIPGVIIALSLLLDKVLRTATQPNRLELNVKDIYGTNTQAFFYGDPVVDRNLYENYANLASERYQMHVSQLAADTNGPDPINTWLLSRANQSLSEYVHNYILGMEMVSDSYHVWFNNEQYHSLPLSIIELYESLLRSVMPNHLKNQVFISVKSMPEFGEKKETTTNFALMVVSWVLTCLVFLPIAFPFLAASYVLFPIREQASKAKLLQMMTGLSPTTFWIASFFFDLLSHLVATGVLFALIALFGDSSSLFGQNDGQNSGIVLFLMILCFGISTIPLMYAFSYYFTSPSGGFIFVMILYLVCGIVGNISLSVAYVVSVYFSVDLGSWYMYLLPIARILPIFSFLFGYQKAYLLSVASSSCESLGKDFCKEMGENSFSFFKNCCPGICEPNCYKDAHALGFGPYSSGIELLYLIFTGLAFFVLIVLFETYKMSILKFCSITFSSLRSRTADENRQLMAVSETDNDVESERVRIEEEVESGQGGNMTDLLTVFKLTKKFGDFVAVDQLTFGVHQDECFGFLGVNGAGKTTTFSMLTGDLIPTSGDAFMKKGQYSLRQHLRQFQSNIGYCPQFDALLDNLTGLETLNLFARLRGVSRRHINRDVTSLVQMVSLEEHAHKLTSTYSGGTRRKLSIAIALIGCPGLVFLDEPSAGVDPAARRKIWQTLGYIKRNLNCSLILTSHSMDECEALCSRIGIMVNGKLRCLGSTQHLRSKYGQGYSIALRLRREYESDQDYFHRVQHELINCIPSASLKDYHQCMMHFHVTDKNETWSNLFTQIGKLNDHFNFEDYFISDTTLEQIFIMFARRQQNEAI